PLDVPAYLRGAVRVAAHSAGVGGGVLLVARRAAVQGQRVADLQIPGAVHGDVAPVGAGAEAVQRVTDAVVLVADLLAPIPVDGLLVHASRCGAGAPVGEVRVVAALGPS